MALWIGKRIGRGLIVICAVTIVGFTMIHLAPGGPAQALASNSGGSNPQLLRLIDKAYGLNRPFYVQYFSYMDKLIHGNLGISYVYNQSVASLIFSKLPNTLLLASTALVVAILVGTIMGAVAGRKNSSAWSSGVTGTAMLGYSVPAFWIALELILLFAGVLHILPADGMQSEPPYTGLANIADILKHLILPVSSLALAFIAPYALLAQRATSDAMTSDYVRTARAKGLPERRVLFAHGLRNALLPIISLAGLQIGLVISTAIFIEAVFNWPGVGSLALNAVREKDAPIMLGLMVVSSVFVVIVNILTDLAYALADPRVRAGAAVP